jgi:hypothetical protein
MDLNLKNSDKIMATINEEVRKHTFTPEALDFVQKTIEKMASVQADNDGLIAKAKERIDKISEMENDLRIYMKQIDGWKEREAKLLEREEKVNELEKTALKATAKLDGFTGAAAMFLANPQIRREILTDAQQPGEYDANGNWHSGGYTVPQKATITETEA